MVAKIEIINNLPTIVVDGIPLSEMAYITYRPQFNCYSDFAQAGVKLFSVNLNFSEQPINEEAPVLVFQKGIFEQEEPDFGIIDRNFDQILAQCPDAYIFPRINLNLPRKWEEEHPEEVCEKGFGDRPARFSYSSDLWVEAVKDRLAAVVNYIEQSKYKDRVIGYQLGGGNTEEWLPVDPQSGFGIRAKEKFDRFCQERSLEKNAENYYLFNSVTVASRIVELSDFVKELTGQNKLVGSFYGYTLGVDRTKGHNALEMLLNCNAIDFICSPLTYADVRQPGFDLYPMIPIASLREHKKVYFSENDIRTHLTRCISDHPNYTHALWFGPEPSVTAEQLKLAFVRAMLYGYGLWWFDMWGGWYADDVYMSLFEDMQRLCRDGMDEPDADIAVFVDEQSVCASPDGLKLIRRTIRALGLCGAPYDAYVMTDFGDVFEKYKVCILIEPTETVRSNECAARATATAMPVLRIQDDLTSAEELQRKLSDFGVDIPVHRAAVVYRSQNYISLYTPEEGEYDFCDRDTRQFVDLFSGEAISFPTVLQKGTFFLFKRVQPVSI